MRCTFYEEEHDIKGASFSGSKEGGAPPIFKSLSSKEQWSVIMSREHLYEQEHDIKGASLRGGMQGGGPAQRRSPCIRARRQQCLHYVLAACMVIIKH